MAQAEATQLRSLAQASGGPSSSPTTQARGSLGEPALGRSANGSRVATLGFLTAPPAGAPVPIDVTPPTAPAVTDEGAATAALTQLYATWTESLDPETAVADYQVIIRQDSAAGPIIRDFTSVGPVLEATITGLPLVVGRTYVIGVRAKNGGGLFSDVGFSDGILVTAGGTNLPSSITTNTVLQRILSPFIATSTVTVFNNATLTIEPGVEIRFNANTGLTLGSGTAGILNAQGTAARPIIFTSNNAAPLPGQWNGIRFSTTTSASMLDHVIVEYGGAGSDNANIRISAAGPTITNSIIRHSDGFGLFASQKVAITNNTFTANGSFPLHLELTNFPTTFSGNTYTGNTTQAIELGGGALNSTSLTIPHDGLPYQVTGLIDVNSGAFNPASLTLQPGVTLKFPGGVPLRVGAFGVSFPGTLLAQGTAEAPITFTTANPTPAPGQWSGLVFGGGTTAASRLDFCVIEYGGSGGGSNANLTLSSTTLPIRSSILRHSAGRGLSATSSAPVLEGNAFTQNVGDGLVLSSSSSSLTIVERNTITNNNRGIVISGSGPVQIRNNTISGNTVAGLANESSAGVVARINFWGNASGPSGIGPGSGNSISGNVQFEPWLESAATDPFGWRDALESPDPFPQTGGRTTFFGTFNAPANWTITLKDTANTTVKTFAGGGATFAQDWLGDNASNAALPNGTYAYRFNATSAATAQAAATAIGRITLDNTLPIANITSPTPDQMLAGGGVVNIMGSASGVNFQSYRVEFGEGVVPTSFTQITSSTTPVTNGQLAAWNTTGLTRPVFTLRLTVTQTVGPSANESVSTRLLIFANVSDSFDPFSPNADAKRETTTISATATFPVDGALTLRNGANTAVRSFPFSGMSFSQVWDGRDQGGAVVPDGIYSYQFQGTNAETGVATTSAAGQSTVDVTPPTAVITAPAEGQTILTDDPLPFVGTADDVNFSSYQLFQGVGISPTSFPMLVTSFSRVVDGTLFTLGKNQLPPNTYTFRLTVTDKADNTTTINRIATLDHLTLTPISASPAIIDPFTGQQASIGYALNRPADVTIRLFDQPTRGLVRTLTHPARPAGANAISWDGRNTAGNVAAQEAYFFTIEATDAIGRRGTYNDAASPRLAPAPLTSNHAVSATSFDPFQNDQVQISYTFNALGRLRIALFPPSGPAFRTLLNQAVRTAGNHLELWDGRRDDGTLHAGPFNVFFDVPQAIVENPFVIQRTLPAFDNFRAEAYVIQPVYAETSTLTYELTANASVSVALTDPNGNAVRTLLSNVAQAAGPQQLEWDGRTDSGSVVAVEGDYRVTLMATDPVSGQATTRIGTITVYR